MKGGESFLDGIEEMLQERETSLLLAPLYKMNLAFHKLRPKILRREKEERVFRAVAKHL
jgi:hypothetical protein